MWCRRLGCVANLYCARCLWCWQAMLGVQARGRLQVHVEDRGLLGPRSSCRVRFAHVRLNGGECAASVLRAPGSMALCGMTLHWLPTATTTARTMQPQVCPCWLRYLVHCRSRCHRPNGRDPHLPAQTVCQRHLAFPWGAVAGNATHELTGIRKSDSTP